MTATKRYIRLCTTSIWIMLVSFFFAGCAGGIDDVEILPEVPFVPRADKAMLYSGKNRLLFEWPHPAEEVTRLKIFWNSAADSLVHSITSRTDTLRIYINNLDEGSYQLDVLSYDAQGNNSGKVLLNGVVFGENYATDSRPIGVQNITYTSDNSLLVEWEPLEDTSSLGVQIFYIDEEGNEKQVFAPRNESRCEIPNVSSENEGEIRYRTIFAPGMDIIDTLFSTFHSISYVNRYGTFNSLPGWKFRCKVMVEKQTVENHGGMLLFKQKLDEAIAKASKKFQVEGLNDEGNNQIHFYAIEIESFEGASTQYTTRQWLNDPSLDVMLVVNDNAAPGDDSWGWRRSPYLTLGHDYTGLFGDNAVDALLHEFGHTRGMYDLYLGEVSANRNSISNQAYNAGRCIMNYPYGETLWSEFARFIINTSGPDRVAKSYWSYFPERFGVRVMDKDNNAVEGAELRFYPVIQTSSGNMVRENDVVQYRSVTDAGGTYTFSPPNPFAINQIPHSNMYNFLVQVTYNANGETNTTYSWMPMSDALIAGSKGLAYELQITLAE